MADIIIGLGTERDPEALALHTRRRRFIKNIIRPEVHPSQMKILVRENCKNHPDIKLVSASAIYNCYGMVFASRRCAILGEEDVDMILHDDGYHLLPWDPTAWELGDVMLYRNSEGALRHAGVIIEKTPDLQASRYHIAVLSTWGNTGEYIHAMGDVSPLLGEPCEVRSQRVFLR